MKHTQRHPKIQPALPVAIMGLAACAAAGAWALWPTIGATGRGVPTAEEVLASIQPPDRPVEEALAVAFEAAAFHTPLWIATAPPVEPPAPDPPRVQPPPPLRATLLAIARDASHAVVHDQDADRVVTIRQGDRFQARTVSRIEPARVTLALESGQTQTLDLGYSIGRAVNAVPQQTVTALPPAGGTP